MRIAVLALGLAMITGSCASSGSAASDQARTSNTTTRRENVITTQEIRESAAPNIADMIRQLRPRWPTAVTVFVNNDAIGGYDQLRNLSKSNTAEIRFYTKSEAQMKWSSRYNEVIQVTTR